MPKYRIVKKTYADGSELWFIQEKILLWWVDTTYEYPGPHSKVYTSEDAAKNEVIRLNQQNLRDKVITSEVIK